MKEWHSPSATNGEMRVVNALLEHIDRLEKKVDRILRLIEPKHVTDKAIKP